MVLVFLVTLAYLAWAILRELERRQETPVPAGGDCPGCRQPAGADWLLCPRCRTLLREGCPDCGRAVATFHRHCPFCGRAREVRP